ncbi:MAG: serine O-acetyltransferase, partial [Kangiella sp.]|nr:serine O-acetyltransferase [Kangiella sp.]
RAKHDGDEIFEAYGISADQQDPITQAIRTMYSHANAMEAQLHSICCALKSKGFDLTEFDLPDMDCGKILDGNGKPQTNQQDTPQATDSKDDCNEQSNKDRDSQNSALDEKSDKSE